MVWPCDEKKGDEEWVKKSMEYRVEGRRPVGRPRKTWLESVEVDMAELEIDKEDVHDRSKWRRTNKTHVFCLSSHAVALCESAV